MAHPVAKVVDPVCGMEIYPDAAAAQSEYEGKMYYFCSPGCKQEFDRNPQLFAGHAAEGHSGEHQMLAE